MKFSRRQALVASALVPTAPVWATTRKHAILPPATDPLEEVTERLLALLPDTATYNGTPGSLAGGPLARRMDDYSPTGEAKIRAAYADAKKAVASMRRRGDERTATQRAVVEATLENGTRSAGVPYGKINPFHFAGHVPYVVTQIYGPHIDGLNIMMEQQSLQTPTAVDAWLEKLDAFPRAYGGVVEKIRADRAAGCVPPRILMEKTLPVLDAFQAGPAAAHPLIRALDEGMAKAGLAKRTRQMALRRATLSLQRRARPAMARLRAEIAAMLPSGRTEAGLWAQPEGHVLYAANVRALGDTQLPPEDIHEIGMAEVGRITTQMNTLLAARGMTEGSIGARMAALARDPANQFANSDAGREELLSYVRQKVGDAEALYPKLLPEALIPIQGLVVKRVPVATQDGAPGGFYDGPSLDGSRPGTYWINLRDMAAVARFRLPTLSFHEGVPGHHTQGSVATAFGESPLLLRIASFNAYQEGWALYAERMMADLGAYADDPLGDLGRLQDELFRAVRLVVDTGIHHKRWTREQAIRTMQDITGIAEGRVIAEVERYMAWPGQALGYKLGQLRLLDMREKFRARAGKKADLREFHGTVLEAGAMPLALVEQRLGLV